VISCVLALRISSKWNSLSHSLLLWNVLHVGVGRYKHSYSCPTLHTCCILCIQAVEEEGGFETVNSERKWSKIAERLNYGLTSKGIGTILQQHYKKILYPFDLFNQSKSAEAKMVRFIVIIEESNQIDELCNLRVCVGCDACVCVDIWTRLCIRSKEVAEETC